MLYYIDNNKMLVIGLATGASPIGIYKLLVNWYLEGKLDFSNITTVNLDEYYGLDGSNEHSYRYYMNNHLFNYVNIPAENTYIPNGMTEDVNVQCIDYDSILSRLGNIDLMLLGLGHNGHIGFNEPSLTTHAVDLNPSTIEANSRFFPSMEDVPKKAIIMGLKSIMTAHKVLIVVNGLDKKEILEKSLYGPITPQVPASILQLHPDLTVVVTYGQGNNKGDEHI